MYTRGTKHIYLLYIACEAPETPVKKPIRITNRGHIQRAASRIAGFTHHRSTTCLLQHQSVRECKHRLGISYTRCNVLCIQQYIAFDVQGYSRMVSHQGSKRLIAQTIATGAHSNQDQICLVKTLEYMDVCVHDGS